MTARPIRARRHADCGRARNSRARPGSEHFAELGAGERAHARPAAEEGGIAGQTALTVVCCSMISLSQTWYGSGVVRRGAPGQITALAVVPGKQRVGDRRLRLRPFSRRAPRICQSFRPARRPWCKIGAPKQGRRALHLQGPMDDKRRSWPEGRAAPRRSAPLWRACSIPRRGRAASPPPRSSPNGRPSSARSLRGSPCPTGWCGRGASRDRGAARPAKGWRAEGATLVLRVDGPRAIEVQHRSGKILDRVNTYFGYRAVAEMRILQAPVVRAGRPPPAPPALDPGLRPGLGRDRRPGLARALRGSARQGVPSARRDKDRPLSRSCQERFCNECRPPERGPAAQQVEWKA